MWQVAVLWCYVEGVSTVKVAVRQMFEKYSNVKFNENPTSRSRVVPCGQTDMTKLIVALCNFANATKKKKNCDYGNLR